MTPDDSAFWKMESEVSRMHSVTLAIFEPPAPTVAELRRHAQPRLALVPRFRQRVVPIPLDLGRPLWVDDPGFDIDQHLVRTRCTSGMAGLQELVSIIVSEPLDRDRPLWELTLVTDLPGDQWALVSKVHHSLIDGLFGTEPLAVLTDGTGRQPAPAADWEPPAVPGAAMLVGRTLAGLLFDPTEQYRAYRANLRRTRRRWDRLAHRRQPGPAAELAGLTGLAGPRRTWTSAAVPSEIVRAARARFGASTHEVVLAVVASGLRDLLIARDEGAGRYPDIRAVVPMAAVDATNGLDAGIEAELIDLPTSERDLGTRIGRVRDRSREPDDNPVTVNAGAGIAGFAAPTLASLALREATRRGTAEGDVQTVVVNVPGPRTELSVWGRPMTRTYPVMPLPPGIRVTVGAFSYRGLMTFGVTADRDALPDAHVVTTGIERAAHDLDQYIKEVTDATS
jgi:WS/DGAT/MGAT family acyltransferase